MMITYEKTNGEAGTKICELAEAFGELAQAKAMKSPYRKFKMESYQEVAPQ